MLAMLGVMKLQFKHVYDLSVCPSDAAQTTKLQNSAN